MWWKWVMALLAASFIFAVSSVGYWVYQQIEKKDMEIERLDKFANRKPRNDLPHIGYMAPKIELPNANNEMIALAGSEKHTLVVFWTEWSSHCQTELEKIKQLYAEKGKDIRFLLVNDAENDDEKSAAALVNEKSLGEVTVYDREGLVSEDYGIEVYPTVFLVGTDGKIKDRWVGTLTEQEWNERLSPVAHAQANQ
ncbi:TlpA family protein disulfide reductase [Brevibacillus migulae]|uniref:TlpA family protein disulfide reductase n=1 Tax=Brevibacillus migulae TaxID=1644114 RepID=UPI00106EA655|nr:TlpA disulfide reductase family protein [Brevibacillus migulae]